MISRISKLSLKIIKVILFLMIILILSPIMILNYFLILFTIIYSPPNYENQGSKGQALYEGLENPIDWIVVFYHQFMGIEVENHHEKWLKCRKILNKGIIYTIGLILFIGPVLNMGISGYCFINEEKILQENKLLQEEVEKIKNEFKFYGNVHNSKHATSDHYDRIHKVEEFNFEYETVENLENTCIEVMKKNEFVFVNEIQKENIKTLLFEKNGYISEVYFRKEKSLSISLKKYDALRESQWYKILRPIIWITTPLNPFKYFERSNFS